MGFYRAWISGWDGEIHAQNLEIWWKRIMRAGDSCHENFSGFRKIHIFLCNAEIFFSVYGNICGVQVKVFWFYQKLNADWSENSELSHRIFWFFKRKNIYFFLFSIIFYYFAGTRNMQLTKVFFFFPSNFNVSVEILIITFILFFIYC